MLNVCLSITYFHNKIRSIVIIDIIFFIFNSFFTSKIFAHQTNFRKGIEVQRVWKGGGDWYLDYYIVYGICMRSVLLMLDPVIEDE